MKVLLVNTSENKGGAAVACGRILRALRNAGTDAAMMVRNPGDMSEAVVAVGSGLRKNWCFLRERASVWMANGFDRHDLFYIDIANSGIDITSTREFREADVIHLHWINQGYISLRGLDRIMQSGKPVVWTMHDMWPYTGVCHHAGTCTGYTSDCRNCPVLPQRRSGGPAGKVHAGKLKAMEHANVTFVGCSQWISRLCRTSSIAAGHNVVSIPNPIDTSVFRPLDKAAIRSRLGLPQDKKLVMFCSVRTSDERKGMQYLQEACSILKAGQRDDIEIMVLGGDSDNFRSTLSFPVHAMGYVEDSGAMAEFYNAADVFVTPSLQENLPNTIMEALACGVPCVGFDIGGVPEMIVHKSTGYVASYMSAADLAAGIGWVLNAREYPRLSGNATAKVAAEYSEAVVAQQYISLFESLV